VLAEYAARVGADPARWWFLTGDEAATYELIRTSFALPVERKQDALIGFQVSHATRLVVVDAAGRVRGYYAGETPEGRAMARTRALWLAGHGGS
jgi:cytochrome oxidase Cu insertion factor (SCO1/SenC/PrrC family)